MSRIGRGYHGEGEDYWVKEREGASRWVEGIMEREREWAPKIGRGLQRMGEGVKERDMVSRRGRRC